MRRSRLIKALSVLLPAGALGASVALASAPADTLGGSKPSAHLTSGQSVAARLLEIRNGVSTFDQQAAAEAYGDPKLLLARWLNGGGWNRRRFGWR